MGSQYEKVSVPFSCKFLSFIPLILLEVQAYSYPWCMHGAKCFFRHMIFSGYGVLFRALKVQVLSCYPWSWAWAIVSFRQFCTSIRMCGLGAIVTFPLYLKFNFSTPLARSMDYSFFCIFFSGCELSALLTLEYPFAFAWCAWVTAAMMW